jgi:hypothetical protein
MQASAVLAILRGEAKLSVERGNGFICRTQVSSRLLASPPEDFLAMTDQEASVWMAKWGILPRQIKILDDLLWLPRQIN